MKLKAEFQGSNRDMYRPEAIVATSGQTKSSRAEPKAQSRDPVAKP
ncbi:MAG: hypothetical protein ABI233_03115 [Chthoniobacterales bacterium]